MIGGLQKLLTELKSFVQAMMENQNYKHYGIQSTQQETHVYCLSARIAFRKIMEENPRSVILASATLPEKKDCEIIFGIQFCQSYRFYLQNPERLYLAVQSNVEEGYTNSEGKKIFKLDFRHGVQKNLEQLQNLKKVLVQYIKHAVGGVLICFPSYPLLKIAYDAWKETREIIQEHEV